MAKNQKDSQGRTLQDGEGQLKDGRYVYTYRDNLNKQKKAYSWTLLPSDRIPKGKKKDKCLRDKEKQIQADLAAGLSVSGKKQTVYELCCAYVALKAPMMRDNTVANYKTSLNIIDSEPFGHFKIGDVTKTIARQFLSHLQNDEGRSYSSIQNVRGVLRPAFEMAVEDDYVRNNPFSFELKEVVKNDTVHRDALNADELRMFLEYIKNHKHYSQYYDMFYLQFHTGMRVSEMCGLTFSDINFGAHFLTVERQLQRKRTMELYLTPPKTVSGARKVPLTPDVEECLHHIIKCRKTPLNEPEVRSDDGTMKASGFLFFDKEGKPMVAQTVENHYRWASKAFKRDVEGATEKMISSHVARHTYCSLRVKEGMQPVTLQKIMGHSSIRTTLGWYTHIEEGDIITEALTLMSKDGSVMGYDEKCDTDE